jgi:hypothetical protein
MAFNQYPAKFFIKQHGATVTLRSRTTGSYDDATGVVAITYADYKTYGFSYKTTPSNLTPNSVIKTERTFLLSDKQINGSLLPFPKVNDQVILGNITYDVVEVDLVISGSTVIYYILKVIG